jgi:hypothetical protein
MGIVAGALPRTAATRSRAITGASFRVAIGPRARPEARPPVKGHWATAARSSGWREATVMAWPPPKELPQIATRVRSMSRCART